MAPEDEGGGARLAEPRPVFGDLTEMTRALAAVGTAWARFDDPFTADWHLAEASSDGHAPVAVPSSAPLSRLPSLGP
ncbi:hypothetical protein B6D25_10095 [Micrococcus luteus]|nr:hypothetical protein B6D25_10095 [Micrococcus luteus]